MRILQVNNYEDIRGGSDRVYQLTTQLLLDNGHEVATLTCGIESFDSRKKSYLIKQNQYVERDLVGTIRNIRDFIYRPESVAVLDQIAKTFCPDIVHLHIFYGQISSSILRKLKSFNIPCVMTVHEYRMLCPTSNMFIKTLGNCERCPKHGYHHSILNRCNRGSIAASTLSVLECMIRDSFFNYETYIDHFLMVSEFCKSKHVEYRPALAGKSSVLYNFVYFPAEINRKFVHVLPKGGRKYLAFGRLSPEKGILLLCEEFKTRPQDVLVIAGDGPQLEELQGNCDEFHNIKFVGKLNETGLREQLQETWFTLVPSECYENNPMTVLESFAMGVPVIGANIGGIPELVFDGQTGFLFSAADRSNLSAMLNKAAALSDEEYALISAKCRELIASRHTASAHYHQLMRAYRSAILRANGNER